MSSSSPAATVIALAIGFLTAISVVAEDNTATQRSRSSEIPGVTVEASATSVQVAEPFWLELTVTAPPASKVTFPANRQQLGDFDILDTRDAWDIPMGPHQANRTWTRRMQMESITTGNLEIPSIEIQVAEPGAAGGQVIRSQPIAVHVASVLEDRADPTQFRDIESVVDVTVPAAATATWPWWAAGGISVLAAAALGLLLVRRRRWLTPAEWARQQIQQLDHAVRSATVDSDAAMVELSNVLREYLQTQCLTQEHAGTTNEWIQAAARRGEIDSAAAERITATLLIADKAKFAGWQLSKDELQNVIRETGRWIQAHAEHV